MYRNKIMDNLKNTWISQRNDFLQNISKQNFKTEIHLFVYV